MGRTSFADYDSLYRLNDDLDVSKHVNSFYDLTTDNYNLSDCAHILRLLEQPKYVRVFKRSKHSGKMFQRLFLAQELKADPDDSSAIWVMKFSKDGKFLAVGRKDGSILIWKVISSPLDRSSTQRSSSGSNGNRSRSTSSSSTTKLNSSMLSIYTNDQNDIGPDRSLLVCPDSSYSINNSVFAPIFENKPIRHIKAHSQGVTSLDWSKNNFLISGSMDNSAKIWHVDREECLREFKHEEFVTSVNFHPKDDRFFISGCMDSYIRLWSIIDGEVSFQRKLLGLITAAAFTPDGETCVAGGLGWVSVLETKGMDRKFDFHIKGTSTAEAKGPKITGIETVVETDEQGVSQTKLLITTNDSRIRKFNLDTRKVETKYKGLVNDHSQIAATSSENNEFVVSGSENHWCYLWSLSSESHVSGKEKAKETLKKLFQSTSSRANQGDNKDTTTQKNGNYLVFHSNHTDVTCASFAPIATAKLIELSNDPLYELYSTYQLKVKQKINLTDDTLVPSITSRDSMISLTALHRNTKDDQINPAISFIVTADKDGNIRVFRRDFVYNIRKALRHDLRHKIHKGRTDNSDIISQSSASLRPLSPLSRTFGSSSLLSSKAISSIPDTFVPVGLGPVDSDSLTLSSNSSLEDLQAKMREHSSRDTQTPIVGDEPLHIRGRKRVNSLDEAKQKLLSSEKLI